MLHSCLSEKQQQQPPLPLWPNWKTSSNKSPQGPATDCLSDLFTRFLFPFFLSPLILLDHERLNQFFSRKPSAPVSRLPKLRQFSPQSPSGKIVSMSTKSFPIATHLTPTQATSKHKRQRITATNRAPKRRQN